MDPALLRSGLEQIAADLTVAGEPVAFDVVVERHFLLLSQARAAGLRVPSIAKLLARAGAKRPDGTPFTADQLRASLSRARRRQVTVTANAPPTDASVPAPARISAPPPRPLRSSTSRTVPAGKALATPPSPPGEVAIAGDLDLSDTELRLARERLRRL
jgi:hypothetical protein